MYSSHLLGGRDGRRADWILCLQNHRLERDTYQVLLMLLVGLEIVGDGHRIKRICDRVEVDHVSWCGCVGIAIVTWVHKIQSLQSILLNFLSSMEVCSHIAYLMSELYVHLNPFLPQ